MKKFVQYSVPRDPAFQNKLRALFARVRTLRFERGDDLMQYSQTWVLNTACVFTDSEMAQVYFDLSQQYDLRSVSFKDRGELLTSVKVHLPYWRCARLRSAEIPLHAPFDLSTRDLISTSLLLLSEHKDDHLIQMLKSAPLLLSGRFGHPVMPTGKLV